MAQTGYTPISIYYSSTATNVPTAGNLVAGELAINTADGKLFYKDSAGVVQTIATKGGVGSSSTTQVLYNNAGTIAGSANFVFDGSNVGIGTTINTTNIGGTYGLLTVGKTGGSGVFMGQSDLTASGSSVAQFFGKTTGTAGYQLVGGMVVATDGSSTTNAVGRLQFYTATGGALNESMRIDSNGNVLIGTTTATNNLRLNAKLAVVTAGAGSYGGLNFTNYSGTTAAAASFIDFNRSRGTTDGSLTAVTSGDTLGYTVYRGADGTAFYEAATILCEAGTVSSGSVAGNLVFKTSSVGAGSSTEKLRINPYGTLILTGANNTDTGVGIAFPATQVASSNANTLDDYEEGTWTPTIYGTTTAGTPVYVIQDGRYEKIGRMVHAWGRVQINAWVGPVGNVYFAGLPFTSINTGANGCSTTLGYISTTTLNSGYSFFGMDVLPNSTSIRLIQSGSNQGATLVPVGNVAPANFDIEFCAVYTV
jgi:hypothetical protein